MVTDKEVARDIANMVQGKIEVTTAEGHIPLSHTEASDVVEIIRRLAAAPEPQPEPFPPNDPDWRDVKEALAKWLRSERRCGGGGSPDPDEVLKRLAVVIDQCEKVDWLQGVWYNLARDAAAVIRRLRDERTNR